MNKEFRRYVNFNMCAGSLWQVISPSLGPAAFEKEDILLILDDPNHVSCDMMSVQCARTGQVHSISWVWMEQNAGRIH